MKKKKPINTIKVNLARVFFFITIGCFFFTETITAQNYKLVAITGVFSGNNTNNTLFKATSSAIPSLTYIRAQRIKGPQDGNFTQSGDNIRYTSTSTVSGIPENASRIRFSFLQSDKKTPIPLHNFRVVINDIDGPNNEALVTNCNANVRFIATANPTNLIIDANPPNLSATGSADENDGYTSRVMFQFSNISFIEFDNYANNRYLKDFDLNYNDFLISKPSYIECLEEKRTLLPNEFLKVRELIVIRVNPIYFDLDKSEIQKKAAIELEKVLYVMNKYPKLHIELQAHTDSRALDLYNIKLSEKRAKSGVNWLANKGINLHRISGKGYGETQLINKCSNGVKCTEEEHQINRRIEFVVINPEAIKQ